MEKNIRMPKKKLKLTQAFTLVELLAVMILIMILAGLIMSVGSAARRKAVETKAQVMIASLEVAISMYHTDTGEYPGDTTLYGDLTTDPGVAGWRGSYMEFDRKDISGTQIVDPWGRAYFYNGLETTAPITAPSNNSNSFDLWSIGADGESTTAAEKKDDITNW